MLFVAILSVFAIASLVAFRQLLHMLQYLSLFAIAMLALTAICVSTS